MKYIKKFDTVSAQTEYLTNNELDTYVGYVGETQDVYYDDAIIINYSKKYLTIEALEDGDLSFTCSRYNVLQYSTGNVWNTMTSADTISFKAGDNIKLKCDNPDTTYGGFVKIHYSGLFNVYGNVLSLHYGDNFTGQTFMKSFGLTGLFGENNTLISAENLILPATTAQHCYNAMFQNCTSLTTAPVLPATTLADSCYMQMFYGCTSLNYIKCLATNISASRCTNNWVNGVANSGTFVKAASMSSWTHSVDGIPTGWTVQNDDGSPVDDGGDWGQ